MPVVLPLISIGLIGSDPPCLQHSPNCPRHVQDRFHPLGSLISNVGQDLFQSILVIAPPELKLSKGSHYNPLVHTHTHHGMKELKQPKQLTVRVSQSILCSLLEWKPSYFARRLIIIDHHCWGQKQCQPFTTCYNYNISLFPSPFQAWKKSHLCRPSLAASLFALAVLATYFTARVCSSVKTWAALSSLAGYWEKMAVGRTLQFCNYIH